MSPTGPSPRARAASAHRLVRARAPRPVGPPATGWIRPLAVAASLAVGACSDPPPARPPLVVWIEVDTLRADALGAYGNRARGEDGCAPSPRIDALAAEGVLFERAYAPAPWTIPSLATQLSGRWPWEHGCDRLLEVCDADSAALVPRLAERGVRSAGVMTNFVARGRFGFARGFELWDEALAQGHEGSTADEAARSLLALQDRLGGARAEPRLLFLWLFDPHYRYEEHAGRRFGPGWGDRAREPYAGPLTGDEPLNALLARRAELSPEDHAFLRGRYASEVAEADRAVGIVLDGLAERGLLDDAWVVLTADHGEELFDRGFLGHAHGLHEELVRVPLIVRPPRGVAPGRRGARVAHPVSLIDLPATVHELAAGVAPGTGGAPPLGHSRSLLRTVVEGDAPERRWLYLHTSFEPVVADAAAAEKRAHQWGVVDARDGTKWVVDHLADGGGPRARLYDLARDPLEQRDLAATAEGAERSRALRRLRALVPEALAPGEAPAPARLAEEPWIEPPADRAGLGPAFEGAPR